MEGEDLIVCDSDVLIEFLDRENLEIKEKLGSVGFRNLCASAVSVGELLAGARDQKHSKKIQTFTSELIVVPITEAVTDVYLNLIKQYSLSHGLKVQDALIAATVLVFDLRFYTLNTKDFRFIKGIRLFQ